MGVIYKDGIPYGGSSASIEGTSDYVELSNKPSINNVTLAGDKTVGELDIVDNETITVDANNKLALKRPPRVEGTALIF